MKLCFWAIFLLFCIALSGCIAETNMAHTYVADPAAYRLSSGDIIRLAVFDQPSLSNLYGVDASGNVAIPGVGAVKAENRTTRQLEGAIAARLREEKLLEDPKVAVEVGVYRPFSILGEVRTPGRFPYSPGMTIEAAVAAAGGYTIHADRDSVRVTRRIGNEMLSENLTAGSTFRPGDTIYVYERWY